MKTPLNRLPAAQLARMIAAHEVSCEAVAHSFIDAVREREREVHAFAWFDAGRALEVAREFDRVEWRGALHGLPVAVKDNIDTADIPSEYGSAVFIGHVPSSRLRLYRRVAQRRRLRVRQDGDGGASANFTPGPTRNPRGLDHTPGAADGAAPRRRSRRTWHRSHLGPRQQDR